MAASRLKEAERRKLRLHPALLRRTRCHGARTHASRCLGARCSAARRRRREYRFDAHLPHPAGAVPGEHNRRSLPATADDARQLEPSGQLLAGRWAGAAEVPEGGRGRRRPFGRRLCSSSSRGSRWRRRRQRRRRTPGSRGRRSSGAQRGRRRWRRQQQRRRRQRSARGRQPWRRWHRPDQAASIVRCQLRHSHTRCVAVVIAIAVARRCVPSLLPSHPRAARSARRKAGAISSSGRRVRQKRTIRARGSGSWRRHQLCRRGAPRPRLWAGGARTRQDGGRRQVGLALGGPWSPGGCKSRHRALCCGCRGRHRQRTRLALPRKRDIAQLRLHEGQTRTAKAILDARTRAGRDRRTIVVVAFASRWRYGRRRRRQGNAPKLRA